MRILVPLGAFFPFWSRDKRRSHRSSRGLIYVGQDLTGGGIDPLFLTGLFTVLILSECLVNGPAPGLCDGRPMRRSALGLRILRFLSSCWLFVDGCIQSSFESEKGPDRARRGKGCDACNTTRATQIGRSISRVSYVGTTAMDGFDSAATRHGIKT